MAIRFKCACCDEIVEDMPSFAWEKPLSYFEVPKETREADIFLTGELCVIADERFFIRGCIEIPVFGSEDPFIWGVWVSLSEENFMEFQESLAKNERSSYGPYPGWLNVSIPAYPETENLKAIIHIRNDGIRPYIELETNEHPLAIEQQEGITVNRVAEIYATIEHGNNNRQPRETRESPSISGNV